MEDRFRRNNLRFDGVSESPSENWEQSVEIIKNLIRNKLEITDKIEIERAHRVGVKRPGINPRPRPLVVKFLRFVDRDRILRSSGKLKIRFFKDTLM